MKNVNRLKIVLFVGAALSTAACTHSHHRHISANHVHNQSHKVSIYKPYKRYGYHGPTWRHRANYHSVNADHYVLHHELVDNTLQDADGYVADQLRYNAASAAWTLPAHAFRPLHTHKLLGDYAEQITMKLVENMRYVKVNTPIAVASFVHLDGSLTQTNILGNQLAESFITELQAFGIQVIDYKTTNTIHVGRAGDFVFSRDLNELDQNPHVKYVLSGTMTNNDRGVILNVRMIDLRTKVIVASSKGFVPQFVVESLYPRGFSDGITLDATS
jgi:TolB-like protein